MTRRSRLVGLLVTAAGVVGVLVASSAAALTAPRTVALHLTLNGSGTLRVRGNPAFSCHASPTRAHCRHTFQVRKGRRIVLKESPARGWKLWKWSGLACHGSAATCSLRVKARRFGFVTASFLPPGDRLNPIPLQTSGDIGNGWTLKVIGVAPNAYGHVIDNAPPMYPPAVPPAGAQFVVIDLSMTYNGSGSAGLEPPAVQWFAEGSHNFKYHYFDDTGCGPGVNVILPAPDLQPLIESDQSVFSGQSVNGNICMTIASNDAAGLLLDGGDDEMTGLPVWFALH